MSSPYELSSVALSTLSVNEAKLSSNSINFAFLSGCQMTQFL